MTFDELQQAITDKQVEIAKPDSIMATESEVDQHANPSLDEFLNMLIHLRTIRLGRLSFVKLDEAKDSIIAHFKPTRFLTVRVFITGKSASTPTVMQFNNDTGNNYLYNATANNSSVNSIPLENVNTPDDMWSILEIENVRELGKMILYRTMRWTGTAGGSSTKVDGIGAWDNKITQITSIQLTPSAGGGATFGAGSFIEVFGHD